MELLADLLKISIPAALVLYAMYLTMRAFVNKEALALKQHHEATMQLKQAEIARLEQEIKLKNRETLLPLRLQAYERMALFLERISPTQLIPRLNNPEMSIGLYQAILLQEIRNEFAHNLSQQIYMSAEAWLMVKKAMEETILFINNSTIGLDEDAPAPELSKQILMNAHQHNVNPSAAAIDYLREEVRVIFGGE